MESVYWIPNENWAFQNKNPNVSLLLASILFPGGGIWVSTVSHYADNVDSVKSIVGELDKDDASK